MSTAVKKRKRRRVWDPGSEPLRSRSWRWNRAKKLAGAKKDEALTPKKFDDQYVRRARNYLIRQNEITDMVTRNAKGFDSDAALAKLRMDYPAISEAARIYSPATTKRWAIEALVLAQVPPEMIADEFGCDPEIIIAYETYFYDVRSRLDNELFILDELLSPALKSTHGDDQDFFWKSLAYCHGAPVLKVMMSYGRIPEDMQGQLAEFTMSMQRRNVAKASIARQINQFNAHEIMEEDLAAKQIDNDKEMSSAAAQMAAGADILLQSVGFAMASAANIGVGGIEGRVGHTIKELAAGNNSGNNNTATPVVPDGILAARDAKRREETAKAETQVTESRNGVPESKVPQRKPLVTPVGEPEDAEVVKDRIAKKKADAVKRLKKKSKRG